MSGGEVCEICRAARPVTYRSERLGRLAVCVPCIGEEYPLTLVTSSRDSYIPASWVWAPNVAVRRVADGDEGAGMPA